jgi:type VI secretion system protein ImpL
VIRDSLFLGGGTVPGVQFEMMPVDLDAQATQVVFDLDGQSISYRHGPQRPFRLKWPGPDGPSQVRVSFAPLIPGQRSSISRDGPWSWFRMLDEATIDKSGLADRFNVTFDVGNRKVTYELRASSVVNPFTLPELEQFRCPPTL